LLVEEEFHTKNFETLLPKSIKSIENFVSEAQNRQNLISHSNEVLMECRRPRMFPWVTAAISVEQKFHIFTKTAAKSCKSMQKIAIDAPK
jgi:hypothetical protein